MEFFDWPGFLTFALPYWGGAIVACVLIWLIFQERRPVLDRQGKYYLSLAGGAACLLVGFFLNSPGFSDVQPEPLASGFLAAFAVLFARIALRNGGMSPVAWVIGLIGLFSLTVLSLAFARFIRL